MKKFIALIGKSTPWLALAAGCWGMYVLVRFFWQQFISLKPELSAALLTAATTILVATLSVLLARSFEKKREVEAQFRGAKTEAYDAFLKRFFDLYQNPENVGDDLVDFLREWQRKLILWGGTDTLLSFTNWKEHLAKGTPDAQSMVLTDKLFRAIRKDLGLSSTALPAGFFIRLILRHPEIFFAMYKKNTKITLEEIAKVEKAMGLEG